MRRSSIVMFAFTILIIFYVLSTQIVKAELKTTLPNYISALPTVTPNYSVLAPPNSTISEQPPASSPPPEPFPIELFYATAAIASAIAIVALTGIVLKKKLE